MRVTASRPTVPTSSRPISASARVAASLRLCSVTSSMVPTVAGRPSQITGVTMQSTVT